MIKKAAVVLAALVLTVMTASSVHAAVFLKIDGIDGESVDETQRGAIDIQSFSWGMSNSGSAIGGGGGAGKASFQDFHFTKSLDKSSPQLALHCASGKHIAKAELVVRKSGERDGGYYVITLEEVFVTSVSVGGTGGGELPTESFSLNFTKITWEYTPTNADGSAGTPVKTGWDLATNTKI